MCSLKCEVLCRTTAQNAAEAAYGGLCLSAPRVAGQSEGGSLGGSVFRISYGLSRLGACSLRVALWYQVSHIALAVGFKC